MRWTIATMLAVSVVALSTSVGLAAEPEDAGLSAAQSSVRNARDSIQSREVTPDARPANLQCAQGKTHCRVKTERADQPRVR